VASRVRTKVKIKKAAMCREADAAGVIFFERLSPVLLSVEHLKSNTNNMFTPSCYKGVDILATSSTICLGILHLTSNSHSRSFKVRVVVSFRCH